MRKFLIVLALTGGMLASAVYLTVGVWPAAASGPVLYLVSPQGRELAVAQFPVEIWARNANNLAAWEAELTYDANRLQILDMRLASEFAPEKPACRPAQTRCGLALGPVISGQDGSGRALVGAASYGSGAAPTGTVRLATLQFRYTGAGGDVALQLAGPLAADPNANPVVPTTEGVTLTLSAEPSHDLYVPSISR